MTILQSTMYGNKIFMHSKYITMRYRKIFVLFFGIWSFLNVSATDYGQKSKIQDGLIFHCFDWSYLQVQNNLATIAKAGFTAIQLSPAQAPVNYTYNPSGTDNTYTWYWLYQPLGFSVAEYGPLGTETQLATLCSNAHKYGLKVIVDVVANHLAGDHTSIDTELKSSEYWHTYGSNIDYGNRYAITHGDIGMQDLATENSFVQKKVHAYIEQLKADSVDGIRWDAAKHIGLPSEGDEFWSVVPDKDMFNYGEILTGPTDNKLHDDLMAEYTDYISVTDNTYGSDLVSSLNDKKAPTVTGNWRYRGIADDKLVLWAESHDTYCNTGGTTKSISSAVIDRAYTIEATLQSSPVLYFSRPAATVNDEIKAGVEGYTSVNSYPVKYANTFHNILSGEKAFYKTFDGVLSFIYRKDGFVFVSATGSTKDSVKVANPNGYVRPGKYRNMGNLMASVYFVVTADSIKGKFSGVNSEGIAICYNATPKLLNLCEDKTFVPAAATDMTATMSRKLIANKWNTVCLPFALSEDQIANTFGSDAKVAEYVGMSGSSLFFKYVTNMTAATPYIISVTTDGANYEFDDVDVVTDSPKMVTHDGYSFVGNYDTTYVPKGDLYIAQNKFWVAPEDNYTSLKPFRAYFSSSAVGSKSFNIVIDDITNGIITVKDSPEKKDDDTVYDICGRKVDITAAHKGLYIINGKKVIMR
mgnify:CR=1 FL=1